MSMPPDLGRGLGPDPSVTLHGSADVRKGRFEVGIRLGSGSFKRAVAALAISLTALGVTVVTRQLNRQPQADPSNRDVPPASASPFPDITSSPSPQPDIIYTLDPTSVTTTPAQQFGEAQDCGEDYDNASNAEYPEIFFFRCTDNLGNPVTVRYRKKANGDVDVQANTRTGEGETVTVPAATWEEILMATTIAPDGCRATVTAGAERPSVTLACPVPIQ